MTDFKTCTCERKMAADVYKRGSCVLTPTKHRMDSLGQEHLKWRCRPRHTCAPFYFLISRGRFTGQSFSDNKSSEPSPSAPGCVRPCLYIVILMFLRMLYLSHHKKMKNAKCVKRKVSLIDWGLCLPGSSHEPHTLYLDGSKLRITLSGYLEADTPTPWKDHSAR